MQNPQSYEFLNVGGFTFLLNKTPPYNKSDFRKNSEIARIASFGRTIVLWGSFDRILSKLFE